MVGIVNLALIFKKSIIEELPGQELKNHEYDMKKVICLGYNSHIIF